METPKINLNISEKAFRKMSFYSKECDSEILGLLIIDKEENKLIVEDVILLEQEASYGSCELDEEKLAKFMFKYPKKLGKIRGWWHSHAESGVFWSVTDENTIERLQKTMRYVLSIVTNKKGEILLRVDVKEPKVTFDNISYHISFNKDNKFDKKLKKEIKRKVKPEIWESQKVSPYYGDTTKGKGDICMVDKPYYGDTTLQKTLGNCPRCGQGTLIDDGISNVVYCDRCGEVVRKGDEEYEFGY